MMALRGIKVIEFAGLAPGPFCGMILSDFGAKVIRIDKPHSVDMDKLARGKRSIAIDMKKQDGISIVKKLCSDADVLIEPFRAGVMEKLGLGPKSLLSENPKLVYARLTGYGQRGIMSSRAGHDINYIATSGVLSYLRRKGKKPHAPVNLLADFAGGGMTCALGIMLALYERTQSGQGQVIDASMVEGSAYVANWLWRSSDLPIWGRPPGENLLDGGAPFYDTYETADNKYMAVGALEPQFYIKLLQGLGLSIDDYPQSLSKSDKLKDKLMQLFATKTRDEWTEIFKDSDACCTPVLEPNEAPIHPHNVENKSFLQSTDGKYESGPAPKLSRTPGVDKVLPSPQLGQHTVEILKEIGFSADTIQKFIDSEVIHQRQSSAKL
ncbi:alpha-methylacyl-CoA racemase-like [Saccostrea echinata]|uniref:alpha-methylacyl-CoA racemase-like n=1 Tax=Saccostrea echinata TaxID=191078 RepID=UPI002A7FCEBC|nr:alpha-methylacyl-CoA racemase-like [Saccostrea echinata]